ncbi:MAG: zinc-dependent metalloprotease, partial [Ilumatobacteraceae bacterium]
AVSSEEQREMEPQLDAAVAAVVGFTDWIVDAVSVRVVGGSALRIAEAVRRQRVEQSPSDVFVHRLLGIRLDEDQVRSGKQFVQGVVDRVGDDAAIAMLLTGNDRCPTPSEIAAPGLWIARVSES